MSRVKIGVTLHRPLFDSLFLPEDRARLDALGHVVYHESDQPMTVEQACVMLADCEIGVGSWRTPYPNAELMAACPGLVLWEHVAGSVHAMFGPHLTGRNLTIASCKTAIADNVAEYVLGQILLGLRSTFPNAAANRVGAAKKPAALRTLFGATIGVVAASEVGRRVIGLLRPFPCKILLYDPFMTTERAEAMGATLVDDLLALCQQSDVVTLHTPKLPQTRHILNATHFAVMRDDAIVINTSRGECLDELGLIAELEKGRLFAFLDVSNPEPAAPDSPLRTLPNVVYTSHIAGPPAFNMGRQAVDDIEKFLRGEQPLCPVTEDMLAYTA